MLIGTTITIQQAKNTTLNGKHGTVIDETKNTITIIESNTTQRLTIIKDQLLTIEEHP